MAEFPWSLFLSPWFLWVRAALAAAAGYFLCRHRYSFALVVACLVGYWAYNSIRLMVDWRAELLNTEGGLRYMIHAYSALLMPYAFMLLGLAMRQQKGIAEPGAAPNGGPATPVENPNAPGGPPSVS